MTADLDQPGALPDGPSAAPDSLAADGTTVPTHPAAARRGGLDAWFPPGGEDDAPPERVADERRMTRLLVLMIILLVGVPTLLTLVAFIGQLVSLRGGG